VDIGKPTVSDVGLSREDIHKERMTRDAEKSDAGIGTVRAAMTVVQPPDSLSSLSAKNSRFLETSAIEDNENRAPKLKTIICRGC
jgi:hypothetical protein